MEEYVTRLEYDEHNRRTDDEHRRTNKRLELLEARMDELGLAREDYDWYLDLRRFGSVKHAGYGLGFERLVMYLTGIPNIRDVLPFPRTASGF